MNNLTVSGFFKNSFRGKNYSFLQDSDSIAMFETEDAVSSIIKNIHYPLWLLRHSIGIPGGEENYESHDPLHPMSDKAGRLHDLTYCTDNRENLRDLFFRGLKVNVPADCYSHAVGPIHAGVIEPGHFRFCVRGEVIQHLTIRLGFQHRGILKTLIGKKPSEVMPYAGAVSGDSTVAYSIAFSEAYEKAFQIETDPEIKFIRSILLETERAAIHIGDIGALAEDIGYYPLHGLCSTDRGVPLGIMEALTGSRFGKASVFPGEVRLNRKLTKETLKTLSSNIRSVFERVESLFLRAAAHSTIRERMEDCGTVAMETAVKNSFLGLPARASGVSMDLRKKDPAYSMKIAMNFNDLEEMKGDVWSRFYLRYLELKDTCEWLEKAIPLMDISKSGKGEYIVSRKKAAEGVYFGAAEGWRGNVLAVFDVGSDGRLNDVYLRDPSVLNWHALELAVRGVLIGDFPVNNKSFNLSYAGFDL
ncbi:MAG TPA: metal (Ni/Fe) hydrogenase large subunit [Leptospiraceae bacterium]|nr:metal (Ni/Fe) hydrogenase large subunit [Leptospiraceae bacterium]HNF15142.1 metal (Ni/Fe) hydrogenase large subunit [Leptospiraceae bacterium]HNF25907.1 metal (Ni/Fe) hydrogenase large subunit [Leptospiraceae bacterium]HNI98486.1 metal (Ni/Fe) hydrogenase large subunit [Leptospiraceae bacterium]HNN04540.1 metal (Ni/Fe) hydrogenase large subunit [Leptospiraceae bacterium]